MNKIISVLESKVDLLKSLSYSKLNIQKAIDLSLEVKIEVDKLKDYDNYEIQFFIRNWRDSIDNFGALTIDNEEHDDVNNYWDDAIKQILFDIDIFIIYLKTHELYI
ncbi:hypothetical protein [Lacinutrix sp. Bg11-31]|uniref:hypothetical protein n=1 Tax=Lacinutrix sp. Bg11-31 TaxID=2057808 RepID=UPI000C31096D|nr:hypothetical protein [Lacinutrix sp. Bg11-31]AUC81796.1 hypothetical protein CW733_06495 [Lacinutrix sp. Bg11-31]